MPKPSKNKHGGRRANAGRKDPLEEAIRVYHSLGELRLPADASEETKALAKECRETLLGVMRKPTRHSQAKIQVAKTFLEEICGKVADEHNIREHIVSVQIIKSEKKAVPKLPPSPLLITKPKEGTP
jgi:hypothetical protein